MTDYNLTAQQAQELIEQKLSHNFGVTPAEATDEHFYKATALVVRDLMSKGYSDFMTGRYSRARKRFITYVWNFNGAFPQKQPI